MGLLFVNTRYFEGGINSMRKKLSVFLSLILVLSLVFVPVTGATDSLISAPPVPEQVIEIYHTNDTHSRESAFPYIDTIVSESRAANPATLLLDAGDVLHGKAFALLSEGESIVKVLNLLKYDAIVPGNHDFDYGTARLLELSKEATFPILAANFYTEGTTDLVFAPSAVFELGTKKVAVVGVPTPETLVKSHPDHTAGYAFTETVETTVAAVQAAVDAVRDEVDAVIVIGHLGIEYDTIYSVLSTDIALGVTGIDLIIDGHSHSTTSQIQEFIAENNLNVTVPIVSTGEYNAALGHVTLTVYEGGKIGVNDELIDLTEAAKTVTPNAEVAALIAEGNEKNAEKLAEVIGSTKFNLDGKREEVRGYETNFGWLVAEAMRIAGKGDVAFLNGGSIREPIPAGDITYGQILTALPFSNLVVTKEITGADLTEALELGLGSYPALAGGYPQLSGVNVVIDATKPAGSRVVSVKIDGKEVLDTQVLAFVTNDFLAAGGDGYAMLEKHATSFQGVTVEEAIFDFIKENPDLVGTLPPAILTAVSPVKWAIPGVSAMEADELVPEDLVGRYFTSIERDEFVAVLYNTYIALGGTEQTVVTPHFEDLAGNPYADSIEKAYLAGFVAGVSDTEFSPNGTLKRQELASYLVSLAVALDPTLEVPVVTETGFEDDADTADWAIEKVAYCKSSGLLVGTSATTFSSQVTLNVQTALVAANSARVTLGPDAE
jgi:5'-nucleotidase